MLDLKVRPPEQRFPGVISVILPSRKRPEKLRASLHSLIEKAGQLKAKLEVVVGYDPDDLETFDVAKSSEFGAVKGWMAPGRYGYAGIANYYPPLISRCRGEWVLFWGDDAIMETEGWDNIVRAQPPSVLFTKGHPDGHNCFPIVHMDILEAAGRFPQLPAVDTWWDEIGRWSGRWMDTDITITQHRPDLDSSIAPDQTYVEGRPGYRAQEYYNPYWTAMRREDALKVSKKLGPLGGRPREQWTLEPVTDVERTLEEFEFAGFDDILKTVDDLTRYDRIILGTEPEVIVETGTRNGASARWFSQNYGIDIVTIDINPLVPEPWVLDSPKVTWIRGDSTDPEVVEKVTEIVAGRRAMVSLDSDHSHQHVLKEMELYSPLVSKGCYMVVEDGIFRYASPEKWVRHSFGNPSLGTPLDAIEDFMVAHLGEWERDTKVESVTDKTHHVAGWWKRVG